MIRVCEGCEEMYIDRGDRFMDGWLCEECAKDKWIRMKKQIEKAKKLLQQSITDMLNEEYGE